MNTKHAIFWALALTAFLAANVAASEGSPPRKSSLPQDVTDDPLLNSRLIMFGDKRLRRKTLKWASFNKRTDMIAPLITTLRYLGPQQRPEVVEALQKITRKRIGDDWFKWMQWQQANPQLQPFDGYDVYLTALLSSLDRRFQKFIYPGVSSRIRLEEVVWGGVLAFDGIPPLDQPQMIPASAATYLSDAESVFGIVINGDARAYPYRFMDWHEMLNDMIGGQPVSLAYCTLCGSGILFDARQSVGPALEFGSSGLLYQSNKLMYDRATNSLWNQFTGEPVIGELANSGQKLNALPLVTTTWKRWREMNPETKVMAPSTGFDRPYEPGAAYGDYFRSNKLMFPTLTDDRSLPQKAEVFGLRMSGANKAWPLKNFRGGKVINDQIGVIPVVLIGDSKSRQVRAYRRDQNQFEKANKQLTEIKSGDATWRVAEDALHGPAGEQLTRLPGHLSFWFAWHNYLGGQTLAD
ncbi:MAG: DUF3179 domain-containing protein [Pseudomonadota bacterium]